MSISNHEISNELIAIADSELERLRKTIPDNPPLCFVMLLEATRMYDYLHFGPKDEVKKYGLSFQEVDVLKSGWNLAASFLFKSLKNFSGIPVMESTDESKISAISLLYQLGCVTLLKRTADMVKSGILITDSKCGNIYTFSISLEGKAQFQDKMERSYQENLENTLDKKNFYKNWKLVDYDEVEMAFSNYGNFLSKRFKYEFLNEFLNLKDIESKMSPLIKPWDSGKGIMMGYDSTEELDFHFISVAATAMAEWRDDAGLHPNLNVEGIKIADIMAVAMCLVSFNLKHIEFSSIAADKHREILIFPSLTIWCLLSELINGISDFTKIEREIIEKVFKIISLKAADAALLERHTTKFMPLIIDLENDFVLRPVSSIIGNPLNVIKDLLTMRNPQLINEFSKDRESWLREYLYAMFMGTRYHRIEGNITLRIGRRFITDIDAAIYDNVTGELALFQIKWQDYHFNDVKKLRSKASNLTKELEAWTQKVYEWISSQGVTQLAQNLRLSGEVKLTDPKIYLFGLSKNAVRMKGYGYELKEKRIAIGMWDQFKRNRTEIGPSDSVFGDLFKALKQQEDSEVKATPKPITFKVSDNEFHYTDLWSVTED